MHDDILNVRMTVYSLGGTRMGLLLDIAPEKGFTIIAPSGEKISIKLVKLESQKGALRYYIQAPKEYKIWRDELLDSKGLGQGSSNK